MPHILAPHLLHSSKLLKWPPPHLVRTDRGPHLQSPTTFPRRIKGPPKTKIKNLRPTTKFKTDTPSPDPNPEPELLLIATHNCFMTVITKEEDVIYSDIAGRYPIKSTRGHQYTLVCYYYDINAILT